MPKSYPLPEKTSIYNARLCIDIARRLNIADVWITASLQILDSAGLHVADISDVDVVQFPDKTGTYLVYKLTPVQTTFKVEIKLHD